MCRLTFARERYRDDLAIGTALHDAAHKLRMLEADAQAHFQFSFTIRRM
jgi:hypothetical protein